MKIIKLTEKEGSIFDKVVEWNYNWWGEKSGDSVEKVRCIMAHSVNEDRLPHTYVALLEGEPVGMYQLSMHDDLCSRPDIYPWLINVYVEEKFRGRNICRNLMETVNDTAKAAGAKELFLYTSHVGLYEKFGWQFIGQVETFKEESPIERLYKLDIK